MQWKRFRKDRACYYLVWSWNLIYLLVAAFMLIPYVVIETINNALVNAVPWSFALYSSLTVVFPLSFMILALATGLRRKPFLLLKLFYGIEVPIVFLLLCRIVLLREMNPGMIHLTLNVVLAFCVYLYLSLEHESGKQANRFSSLCRLGTATIVLLVGLYLAGLILPFAVPLGWMFLKSFFPDLLRHINTIILNPFSLIFMPLMLYTATLFIALPFVLLYLYLTAFTKQWRVALSCSGGLSSTAVVAGVMIIETFLFITLNYQNQSEIFALLKPLEGKPEYQIELLDRKDEIRDILTDAYLGAYRYVSTDKKSNGVEVAHQEAFGSSSNWIAQSSQWLFNSLARPFLYHGVDFAEDQELAARYYQLFFDAPIEKAQAERIARAIDVTWERESGAAGLINALSEHVLLAEQAVTVEPRGDAARITISQRLENTTFQPIEVVYHFSLPEEAVLTGVWLSDDPGNPEKYVYRVSPRGAAQQVYKAQVRQRVDPSLLEQVGPRQYRLRAYPVPSRQLEFDGRPRGYLSRVRSYKVEPLFLRFQYETMVDGNGNWPLPNLLEKRNIYWDETTTCRVDEGECDKEPNQWLPSAVIGDKAKPRPHLVQLGDVMVRVIPWEEAVLDSYDISKGGGKEPLAIIVDGSYSMASQEQEVRKALSLLTDRAIDHQVFICREECVKQNATPTVRDYYGSSQIGNQLVRFRAKFDAGHFAGLIVLTDAGSYELEKDAPLEQDQVGLPPLWFVHLGGKLPYAYNDQLLALFRQSGGGIAESPEEALEQLSLRFRANGGKDPFYVTEHYLWYVGDAGDTSDVDDVESPVNAVAARRYLDYLASREKSLSTEVLDKLHHLAVQYHMVTDYSSMIVLVNDVQRKMLDEAEAKNDRFDREIEIGVEEFSTPEEMFTVSAVPEPREVILLTLAGLILLFVHVRKRYIRRVNF